MLEAKSADDIGVTVAHPNSYPHYFTAIGKVVFWYPISLSWPSRECTQFEPRDVKLLLGFFFLNWGALSSRATGSTLYITAYTTCRETICSWTRLSFLCKEVYLGHPFLVLRQFDLVELNVAISAPKTPSILIKIPRHEVYDLWASKVFFYVSS